MKKHKSNVEKRANGKVRAKVALGVCAVLIAITCYSLWSEPSKRDSSSVEAASKKEAIGLPEFRAVTSKSSSSSEIESHKRAKTAKEMAKALGPGPSAIEVASNPGGFVEAALRGDEAAALAVYATAINCIPGSPDRRDSFAVSTNCSERLLALRADKLALLQPAAEKGSALAQLAYASEAMTQGRLKTVSGVSPLTQEQSSTALKYLAQAAEQGVVDAYWQMFLALDAGLITQRDEGTAAAYLAAATMLSPSTYSPASVEQYLAKLRPSERSRAMTMAEGFVRKCCPS